MSGSPEYLESHAGSPAPSAGRRSTWLVVGAVGLVAALGAGGWAAWSFFATGPQPAEALPASTLAYLSVDLDPSGGQKIEALRTLKKFPGFEDRVGVDTDDDLRERLFEEIQSSGECPDLDYGADVEPWLGDRLAMAVVETGESDAAPVLVLQVSDEDGADAGLAKIRDCGDDLAWSVSDGWALLGEEQDVVDRIAEDAASSPLAEDDDFDHWTSAAGASGIATAYLAPNAGSFLADAVGGFTGIPADEVGGAAEAGEATLEGTGAAATLRFEDGGLELSFAGEPDEQLVDLIGSGAGAAVAELPDDTSVALGVSFGEGWVEPYLDQVGASVVDELGMSVDELLAEASRQTGLDLPDDLETLLGESAVLAVGDDLDLSDADGPEDLPVALEVRGDAAAIDEVLDKVRAQVDPDEVVLASEADGDAVVVGPDADYRREVSEGGSLGDTDKFRAAVPEAEDAFYVLFADLDAADDLLDQLADEVPDSADFVANVRPLDAIGFSAWVDGDVAHLVVRVTTD